MMRKILPLSFIPFLFALSSVPVVAQDIARLYAPQAPAGSSFVRVVNPSSQPVNVAFARKEEILDGSKKIATDYRVVDGGKDMALTVDGRTAKPVKLTPGSFNTIVLGGNAQVTVITDATEGRNDLKAEMRFYNLVPGCTATLSLENGPDIFKDVTQDTSQKRAINPVKANVVGRCDKVLSTASALPALKSGDRTSVFLLGDAKAIRVVTQLDATEAYAGTR